MARIDAHLAGGANVLAFLDMIAFSEIGTALLAESDDGYNVLVGSTPAHPLLFDSYADHPNVYNKACNSTAAGRYQIMAHWWPFYRHELGLPDFGPVSQDRYAIQQLVERHAINLLNRGKFHDAVHAVSNIWASLPGAGYGQHENDIDQLAEAYQKAGGVIT
jgi:muramidase (phage lysozyme)